MQRPITELRRFGHSRHVEDMPMVPEAIAAVDTPVVGIRERHSISRLRTGRIAVTMGPRVIPGNSHAAYRTVLNRKEQPMSRTIRGMLACDPTILCSKLPTETNTKIR